MSSRMRLRRERRRSRCIVFALVVPCSLSSYRVRSRFIARALVGSRDRSRRIAIAVVVSRSVSLYRASSRCIVLALVAHSLPLSFVHEVYPEYWRYG